MDFSQAEIRKDIKKGPRPNTTYPSQSKYLMPRRNFAELNPQDFSIFTEYTNDLKFGINI